VDHHAGDELVAETPLEGADASEVVLVNVDRGLYLDGDDPSVLRL
jgi:hypothetical protein